MKNQIHNCARIALIAITALCANASKALTVFHSNTTGNWDGGSMWTSTGSGSPIKYVIDAGDNVTLNVNVSGIDTLEIYGTLTFNNNRDITINANGVVIMRAGGIITGGNALSEIIFTGYAQHIIGPFLGSGSGGVDGTYADGATTTAAAGKPAGAFVSLTLLPVVLSSIEVVPVNADFQLNWTVLGESNMNTFTVEVSENGHDFTFAGTIAGNEEISEGEYSFNIIGMKKDFYVRLSETNTNGTTTQLVTKYVKNTTTIVDAFKFYPTLIAPAGQKINMVLPSSSEYKIVVYTMDMNVAAESTATTYSNNEVVAFNSSDWNLNAGNYVVVVSGTNGETHKTRILVH